MERGVYTVKVPGGQMFITREEAQAKGIPARFISYDATGSHSDSGRCDSCYLGHCHSIALHALDLQQYQARAGK